MAWTNITNAAVAAGAALTTALMTALRDNTVAIVERDPTAPKLPTDFQFIDRVVLSSTATADFTGFDASIYDGYLFTFGCVVPATDNVSFICRTSTDGGSTYDSGASDYRWGYLSTSFNTTPTASAAGDDADSSIAIANQVGSAASEDGVSGSMNLTGPNLAKNTKVAFSTTYTNQGGNGSTTQGGGIRLSQADVNAIRFQFSSGNMESGVITMYGMRND